MDENIPQQPIESAPKNPAHLGIAPNTTKVEHKAKTMRLKGTLENLAPEVKAEMEEYMRKVNPHAAKKYMVEKYGKDYPNLADLSTVSFHNYFKRHKVKMAQELELQKQSAAVTPEIMGVIDAITNPDVSIIDKKTALTALYNACEARNKLLLSRQTSFLDPLYEKLLSDNRKEQHSLIKTVTTLGDQLSRESDKDFLSELESFTQVLLSSVINTYKLIHSSDLSKFSEFSSTLSSNLELNLKSYKSAKEQLKIDKK